MRIAADDVQGLVIPGVGHFVAEEAPDDMAAALNDFLTSYRNEAAVPALAVESLR
jgi:pimeloyl-ACP methyl ester carboxylesterase